MDLFSPEILLSGILFLSLTLYALMGGADYGGGVWDLLAHGPRAQKQRDLIAEAIGPIWEANHVWLILVVVILFTAFPPAFAAIATALHIPLTIMLIGIVLRGSAFTFRSYDQKIDAVQRRWGRVFAIASVFTPVILGISIGALVSGKIHFENGIMVSDFITPWFGFFPFTVGLLTLSLFAFLAAVYLAMETEDKALQGDFRFRALGSNACVAALAVLVFLQAKVEAPLIHTNLIHYSWIPLLAILAMIGTFFFLLSRRYSLARITAVLQATFILWGWGAAQFPYLVVSDLTVFNAVAPSITIRLLLQALGAGVIVLVPSFFYLLWIFKGRKRNGSLT